MQLIFSRLLANSRNDEVSIFRTAIGIEMYSESDYCVNNKSPGFVWCGVDQLG